MYRKILSLVLIISFDSFSALPPTVLSGQSQTTNPTTFKFKVPYSQATQISGIESLIETGNENLLVNPGFEGVANTVPSGWTCTVGTCTKTTTAGEFSSGKAALKVVLSAQSMNVSQTITTPSGIQKQGVVGFIYRIPATGIVTPTVAVTVDSVLQVTVPTNKLIMDGLFHSLEVPVLFGATDIKISFLSGSSTGSVFFDGVYIKQGIGFQNLQLDNVYSAQVSNTGVISNLNKAGWLSGNCVVINTAQFDCPIASGIASQVMNCSGVVTEGVFDGRNIKYDQANSSSTNIRIRSIATATGAALASNFNLTCQKSGNDYLAASAQVYSQASANYSRRAYTPTFTGFGTVTGVSCYESRVGEFNEIDCRFTSGTPTATEARVSLPGTNISGSTISTLEIAGTYTRGSSDGNHGGFSLREAGVSYITFTHQSTFSGNASIGLAKANGDVTVGGATVFQFTARVPISGWSNSAQIVGSFENVPTVPNAGKRIDIFSVSYGQSSLITPCTTANTLCGYIDNIGPSSASAYVTRGVSTGLYTLTVPKTYTKLRCVGSFQNGSADRGITPYSSSAAHTLSCNNCSSTIFTTGNQGTGALDSFGTIQCQGTF